MPDTEVADVGQEAGADDKVNDGKVSMDAGDSDSGDSSAEGTEGQEASGKDDKTTSKGQEADEGAQDDEVKDDGKPIPYKRFKEINDGKNAIKKELEALKTENEEVAELFKNPTVVRAIMQAQGITDPKVIAERMKEAGFEAGEEKSEEQLFGELSKGLDLTTQKGWFEMMKRMSSHFAREAVKPFASESQEKEVQSYIETQETEAKKIAKDTYGIEYGESGKDEKNPNTAIGKMSAYLDKNPGDARLGHVKILKLALAEEGVKAGEKKGVAQEKDRHSKLKASAFEDDAQITKDETPSSDWPVSKILAWRRKYGK